jgi:hypothetical protein
MRATFGPALRANLISHGKNLAERHDWLNTARAHLEAYAGLKELQHA